MMTLGHTPRTTARSEQEALMTEEYSPEKLLQIARGFMESRILLSAAELDLFTLLEAAPLSAEEIANKTGADLRALTALVDALAAMGLLAKTEAGYSCPPGVAHWLGGHSPKTILPMVHHMAGLWPRWSRLTAIVKGYPPAKEKLDLTRNAAELRAFIGAMHSIGTPMAARIAAAVDAGTARALLDVGGGSGTYTIAFLRAVPEMRATLFDLPPVIEMARERLGEKGMLGRTTLVAGNFHHDDFPGGHDLALISAIIHSNSPEENLNLYRRVFRALKAGGRILVRDHVMSPDRTRPRDGAVFAINMLVGTSGGGTYTFGEIEADLDRAGFTGIRLLCEGDHMDAVVEAHRP